ncbi:MAG: glycoside hydrolase family 3 N-terminal domain-containing protein [Thermosynechococcaceae cyanobacterium]
MTQLLPALSDLSLAAQIAQMLVVRASGHLFDHQIQYPAWEPQANTLRHWLQDLGVGGVILLGGSAAEIALRCQQLQDWAKVPLFLTADIEEGVGQRFSGATWFPPPMALAAIADLNQAQTYAEQMGAITAQEALTIGLNWLLAPVVDVNNNPKNPVINVRAFGDDPVTVGKLATAFIRGAQAYPVLTTAKHFPGHGDTATDSHLNLPVVPHTKERLEAIEYPPFKDAIATQVDSIMSAHLLIPELDKNYPATLSDRILTQELRQNMGFEGLIVTDALVMGAIANQYGPNEAAVLAVEAGADILMMPADPPGAIAALCEAVETGRIPSDRIEASLERIWRAKTKVEQLSVNEDSHKHAWELQPPAPIQLNALASTAALKTTADILKASNNVQGLITAHPERQRTVIIVDDLLDCNLLSRKAPAVDLPQKLGYQVQLVDGHTPAPDLQQGSNFDATLLQLFVRGNPFRGSADQSQIVQTWLEFLLKAQQLQAVIVYGSPYVYEQLLPQIPAGIPSAFSYGQMPLAQTIVLEQLFGTALSDS